MLLSPSTTTVTILLLRSRYNVQRPFPVRTLSSTYQPLGFSSDPNNQMTAMKKKEGEEEEAKKEEKKKQEEEQGMLHQVDATVGGLIRGLGQLVGGSAHMATEGIRLAESSARTVLQTVGSVTKTTLDVLEVPKATLPVPESLKVAVRMAGDGAQAGKAVIDTTSAAVEFFGAQGGKLVGSSARMAIEAVLASSASSSSSHTTQAVVEFGVGLTSAIGSVLETAATSSTRVIESAVDEVVGVVDHSLGSDAAQLVNQTIGAVRTASETAAASHLLAPKTLLHHAVRAAKVEAVRSVVKKGDDAHTESDDEDSNDNRKQQRSKSKEKEEIADK